MADRPRITRRRFVGVASTFVATVHPAVLLKVLSAAGRAKAQTCIDIEERDGHFRIGMPGLRENLTAGATRNVVRTTLQDAGFQTEDPEDLSGGELGVRVLATSPAFSLDVVFDAADRVTSFLIRGANVCYSGMRAGMSVGTLRQRFPEFEILAGPDQGPPFFVTRHGVSFELEPPADWDARLRAGDAPKDIVGDAVLATAIVVWR